MKTNEGFVSFSDLINKLKKQEIEKKPINRQAFQLLALEIIKTFNIKKEDQGIIFKFCKENSLTLIQKAISELRQEVKCLPIVYFKSLMRKK